MRVFRALMYDVINFPQKKKNIGAWGRVNPHLLIWKFAAKYYFWPRMASDVKTLIFQCNICRENAVNQKVELLVAINDVYTKPMEAIGSNLFEWANPSI